MRKTTWLLLIMMFIIFFPLQADAATQDNRMANYAHGAFDGELSKEAIEKPLKGKMITVDPGHGGSDVGAVGASGTLEKDVTLAIGLELKTLLENSGAKVVMTRAKDQDVYRSNAPAVKELQARVDVANNSGAELFLSIHVDSFTSRDAGGTTTYYSNRTGDDRRLAQAIQSNLVSRLNLYDRGYRRGDMYVLKESSIPAVLAEVAFISNPAEEKALNSNSFIKMAAKGLFNGIKAYFVG